MKWNFGSTELKLNEPGLGSLLRSQPKAWFWQWLLGNKRTQPRMQLFLGRIRGSSDPAKKKKKNQTHGTPGKKGRARYEIEWAVPTVDINFG